MGEDLREFWKRYGSDQRVAGGREGICRICGRTAVLRLGHIVPKWAYWWMKQEDRGRIVGDYPSLRAKVIEQDGNKEYLLCEDHEQHLSVAENYARVLMAGTPDERTWAGLRVSGPVFDGVKADLLQRFVFGLAVKAHFAHSAPFHRISLPEDDVRILAQRIVNPGSDDLDFPIIAMRFTPGTIPGVDPKAIMVPTFAVNKTGVGILTLLFAGWEWWLVLNRGRTLTEPMILGARLQPGQSFLVPEDDLAVHRFYSPYADLARRRQRGLPLGRFRASWPAAPADGSTRRPRPPLRGRPDSGTRTERRRRKMAKKSRRKNR